MRTEENNENNENRGEQRRTEENRGEQFVFGERGFWDDGCNNHNEHRAQSH
jgi:hypothetical protein